ncbi:hypothetical protein V2J94_27650 [Streptomyces sp. DSM 41524]|uniref:Uncharacterized protein n=6 Tax=Streptomyces violaceusniger group TaxID=2839105 RepID=A0A0A0NKB5_STRRN|nr:MULTISPECIES: hypothetical protein [Streptomyces]MEE4595617.1 hypothetical protein [Streptomyces sp. DSM 41524]AGP60002.1 hypothetical protein M271_43145 [Streptomyces rapamycinicus NRRL 5491]EXU63261.1 hypothetical protein Z951_36895 [Streptomyces sp. PRh5]MBB4788834.1 hypothetical protein [Streptomyces rapamycinicus]MBD3006872.1 hypothetical protein [Streptomyces sp. 5-10]
MADTEFNARGVRIERFLRSVTRAGQVMIKDGRLQLLTSYGSEIDSAPVQSVRASKPWFVDGDQAMATVNGTRYRLTLGSQDAKSTSAKSGSGAASRFLDAVRSARGHASKR